MYPVRKPRADRSKEIRIDLGDLRDRVKIRCVQLNITMKEGVIEALTQWLKEGRRKAA